jgi:hypothetical protein
MKINPAKSGLLQVTRTRCPAPELRIFGGIIPNVPEMRTLGVIFNKAGTATNHIAYLRKKTRPLIQQLRKLQKYPVLASTAYKQMLIPAICHGACAWYAGTTEYQRKQLQKLENNAIKSVLGMPLWFSTTYARSELTRRGMQLPSLLTRSYYQGGLLDPAHPSR